MEAWRGHFHPFKRGTTWTEVPFHHRCKDREIFGSFVDFCPNFPNLPGKLFVHLLPINFLPQRSWRLFWCDLQKRSSCVFLQTWGAIFWSQTTMGAIVAQISKDVVQIFSKSNLWGCACIPCTQGRINHWAIRANGRGLELLGSRPWISKHSFTGFSSF